MAIDCNKLSRGVEGFDCKNPLIPGVKPKAVLINIEDVDIDETELSDGIITKLILKSGKIGYSAETLEDAISTNVAFAKGTYYSGWDQNFVLRIFDNSPKVKKFINELSRSRVIAVVENKYVKYNLAGSDEVKGETVFEVFGFFTGLKLNEATRDSTDADTKGGYVITLGCDDNAKEPMLPITLFYDGGLSATQTAFESLFEQP